MSDLHSDRSLDDCAQLLNNETISRYNLRKRKFMHMGRGDRLASKKKTPAAPLIIDENTPVSIEGF